mgnify:CR=1 FL=1
MPNTDRYVKATAERKWNYIFLLYARYDGSYSRLARAMGIPQAELKNWNVEFKQDVLQWIENNKSNEKNTAVDMTGEAPTLDELIEDVLRKMKSTIGTADDPSALARALKSLHDVKVMTSYEGDENDKNKDVVSAVEQRLKNNKR